MKYFYVSIVLVLLLLSPSRALEASDNSLGITGATKEEIAYIEKQLLDLERLSEFEKKQLRKLITDIKIREEKDIAQNNARLYEARSQIAKDRFKRETFNEDPEEIKETRKLTLEQQEAHNSPVKKVEQLVSSVDVNLNSKQPVEVPIALNMGATIVILDRHNTPFPISNVSDFTNGNFNLVSKDVVKENNIVTAVSVIPYAESNASLFLANQTLPLMLNFKSTPDRNTTRLIIRIQQTSPLTEIQDKVSVSSEGVSRVLYDIADYDDPRNAKQLSLSHGAGQAWEIDGHLLIRTPYILESPFTPEALVSSTEGIENVYRLQMVSSILMNIDNSLIQVDVDRLKNYQTRAAQTFN